ncbi:hypothetical protein SprV_0200899700 [Sparganum proliferum]
MKQGCVREPTLFNLMFSAMPMDACRDERPVIRIAYGTDGHLLNQRECTSSPVYPQPLSTNFCSPMTSSSVQLLKETCNRASIPYLPPAKNSALSSSSSSSSPLGSSRLATLTRIASSGILILPW